jgi:hypothetical protein
MLANWRILAVFLMAILEGPLGADVPVYNAPGVIEGESLKGEHPAVGNFSHLPYAYSTRREAPGVFSGDSELLWCTDGGPSREQMEVNIPVPKDGWYKVLVRLARGPTSGILTLKFDNVYQPSIDCFAPKAGAFDPLDFGNYYLTAGDYPLDFLCASASPGGPQTNLSYGLDYVKLVPIATPSPVHFRATGADDSSIHSVEVGDPHPVPVSDSGDTWDLAWTRQDTVFSPSNDTSGFGVGGNQNLMFNQILGDDPAKLDGKTINQMRDYGGTGESMDKNGLTRTGGDGCSWKSSGCLSLDGVLYWVVARHKYGGDQTFDYDGRQKAHDASFIESTDFGKTWTRSAQENFDHPMFPGSRFATPYFIQYGQDGHEAWADGSDKYIYALSNNGYWDNGDYVILGRCLRTKMAELNGADWQFYMQGDGADDTSWTSNVRDAVPVVSHPDHLGMTRAVYLPKHQCYFMIAWHYPGGGGKISDGHGHPSQWTTVWDFYVAPHPWGPWRTVGSHTWTPQGYYCPGVCPRFNSADESTIWAMTAGDWASPYYKLTAVPLTLK